MTAIKNVLRNYRILLLAVLLSFCWHIFWLSSIKLVIVPDRVEKIRFSKVYFLGPILEKSPIEVRAEPKGRCLLEKRYMENVDAAQYVETWRIDPVYMKYVPRRELSHSNNEALTGLVDESLSGSKLEPAALTL